METGEEQQLEITALIGFIPLEPISEEMSRTSQVLKEPQDPREKKTVGRLFFFCPLAPVAQSLQAFG